MATAGPMVHSSDIDKREKKRLTFKMWTGEGGRRLTCVRCSRALKNLLTPFFFRCFWGHFGCIGVGVVVAVDTEEQGGRGGGRWDQGGRGGGRWDQASHGRDVGPSHLRGSHDHYHIEYCPYWDSQLGHSHRLYGDFQYIKFPLLIGPFPRDLSLNIYKLILYIKFIVGNDGHNTLVMSTLVPIW
jgi:hypothetical protein